MVSKEEKVNKKEKEGMCLDRGNRWEGRESEGKENGKIRRERRGGQCK